VFIGETCSLILKRDFRRIFRKERDETSITQVALNSRLTLSIILSSNFIIINEPAGTQHSSPKDNEEAELILLKWLQNLKAHGLKPEKAI